jgi:hypothetical protein
VVPGVINKAHMTGHYDIVLETGEVLFRVNPKFIRARCLSVSGAFLGPYLCDKAIFTSHVTLFLYKQA